MRILGGKTPPTSSNDLLWNNEEHLVRIQAVAEAAERLLELQDGVSGHRRCPNTQPAPRACDICKRLTGDSFAIWKLLLIINDPT